MWESLYKSTKMPVVPMYGLFPVKLRTHIGAPIYPRPGVTPEELSRQVLVAVEELISQHQQLPGTLTQVLLNLINCKNAPSLKWSFCSIEITLCDPTHRGSSYKEQVMSEKIRKPPKKYVL